MLTPIPVDEFVGYFVKENPEFDALSLKNSCVQAIAHKQNGAKCICCGQPIWAWPMQLVVWICVSPVKQGRLMTVRITK